MKPEKNYTIYYRDWSDVIEENKTRLEYLRAKLEIKQKEIHERALIGSAEEGMEKLENSARLASEIIVTR